MCLNLLAALEESIRRHPAGNHQPAILGGSRVVSHAARGAECGRGITFRPERITVELIGSYRPGRVRGLQRRSVLFPHEPDCPESMFR